MCRQGPGGAIGGGDLHRRYSDASSRQGRGFGSSRGGLLRLGFRRLQRDRVGSNSEPTRSYSAFIPILRVDYALTEKTRILSGIQGFPLLP